MTPRSAWLPALVTFLRTPTLGRSVVGLLTAAILLLLAVNLATLFMIRRTADFNESVEHTQEVRLTAQRVLTLMVDAETGQRGFILTGRPDYLMLYRESVDQLPMEVEALALLVADNPTQARRVERMRAAARIRFDVMRRSLDLAQAGAIGQAVQLVRSGQGKAQMDAIRAQVADIDDAEARLLIDRTESSEGAARLTVAVNAAAGVLIVLLALISLWLVRRYINEVVEAREALDRMNLGLEEKIADRTAALRRANDEIQRFAYIVSHDLRAPLVNVMGYTSELEQAGKTLDLQISRLESANPDLIEQDAVMAVREDVPEAIGFIRASTQKMDRLINAILQLSREGRRGMTPEPLNVTEMVQAIADSVNHQTEAADAEIVVEDLPEIESDRLSLEQIFGNLIDNAVKYLDTSRPGEIRITGEARPGGWVVYRVADNGRGVSKRDHERIFELFRRSGKQDKAGEGLGLAFVRNSVRRLGGTIDIESELGKGSTFTLKFPKRLIVEMGDVA